MGVFQPSGGRRLRFEARLQSAALRGRFPLLPASYSLGCERVRLASRGEVRREWLSGGERDLRTGEWEERGR
jgi:hypothetical protein